MWMESILKQIILSSVAGTKKHDRKDAAAEIPVLHATN